MIERQIGIIAIAIGVVIINGLILVGRNIQGHFFEPNGILLTPIVLIIVSALICYGTKTMRPLWKSILIFGIVALHDILIKLYSDAGSDREGQLYIHLSLFIGLIPAFGILLTSIFKDKRETWANKIIASMLFPTLMGIHLYLFSGLGLGQN